VGYRFKGRYQSWAASPSLSAEAAELAEYYIQRTEAFDRKVCTGVRERDGKKTSVPVNGAERLAVERHARSVLKEVRKEADAKGIPWQDVRDALKKLYKLGKERMSPVEEEKNERILPSFEDVQKVMVTDSNEGFCLFCGAEAYGVEPDTEKHVCDVCGKPGVYGAEQLMLLGLVE
jgi:hypothetical protein